MSTTKLCTVGILAALALSASAAASASATVWRGSLTGTIMKLTVKETTEPLKFKTKSGTVKCTGVKFVNASIELGTVHSAAEALELTGCTLEGAGTCELESTTIKTEPVSDTLSVAEGNVVDKFTPEKGSTLITVKLKKTEGCGLPTSLALTGQVSTMIDKSTSEAETEAKTHTLRLTAESGSELTYEKESVTVTGAATFAVTEGGVFFA
jgi:hypothetical protein